jgi:predicted DNA binding CopG/RHH family protein
MSYKPADEKVTAHINTPLTPFMFAKVEAKAAKQGVSKARFIRDAVEAYLATLEVK